MMGERNERSCKGQCRCGQKSGQKLTDEGRETNSRWAESCETTAAPRLHSEMELAVLLYLACERSTLKKF
jgi:hypothetical protein